MAEPTLENTGDLSTFSRNNATQDKNTAHNQNLKGLIHQMSAVDKRKEDDMVMNKFTTQQRELLREIGGLPMRVLSNVNIQRNSSIVKGSNPFKLTKDQMKQIPFKLGGNGQGLINITAT